MLETLREYAEEKLAESAGREELLGRHAAYFRELAKQAYLHRFAAEAEWSARLETDHDDMRAALDWLLENDPDAALRLVGALGWFWLARARARAPGACLPPSPLPARPAPLARARTAYGALVARLDDAAGHRGARRGGRALARARRPRRAGVGARQPRLAARVRRRGRRSCARGVRGEPGTRRELGDAAGATRALVGIAQVLVAMGETERAEAISRDLLEGSVGDPRTEHFAYHFLADCALIRGDPASAGGRYRESLRAAPPRRRRRDELRGARRGDVGGGSRRSAARARPRRVGRGALGVARPPSRSASGTASSSAISAPHVSSWARRPTRRGRRAARSRSTKR